jgi:tRNA modification GTPase
MARSPDTIAALATPAGTAALAIIRITGPDTARLAGELAGSPPRARTARHADYRDRAGALVDDVLFTFFPEPRSATGEHVLEISCHGNPFIAQRILEDLLARGCRPAEPGEFTRRAFLNGRMDLSQAEAVMDVISARSERALAAANLQMRGALGRHMKPLIDGLVGVVASVEAYIDFPEEDLPPESRAAVRSAIAAVRLGCSQLLATRHYGDLLRDGIRTVIVGEPNAGKSSLLNRLVGRDRAIVSPEPGTTRDFIEERVVVGPHCLRLIDTAGLNPAPGAVERLGIAKSRECIAEADMIVLVLDATRPAPPFDLAIAERLTPERTILALNKADLLPAGSADRAQGTAAEDGPFSRALSGLPAIFISALTGAGVDALKAELIRRADSLRPSAGEDAVVINARHAHALAMADECLGQSLAKLDANAASELLASDLRGALSALGEISGKIDNEAVLDRLFATFCIGK